MAIPGHNMVFVLFGCMLTLVGWLGLDTAGAMLFAGAGVRASANRGEQSGRGQHGTADRVDCDWSSLWQTGCLDQRQRICDRTSFDLGSLLAGFAGGGRGDWTGGRAAGSICSGVAGPAGCGRPERLSSVHAVGGLWGVIAAGAFVQGRPGQWLAQAAMVAALLGFVLPLVYCLNAVLNRIYPFRVHKDEERQGLDLSELGAGAYPELTPLTKDYLQR